jgi:hypothetical protein
MDGWAGFDSAVDGSPLVAAVDAAVAAVADLQACAYRGCPNPAVARFVLRATGELVPCVPSITNYVVRDLRRWDAAGLLDRGLPAVTELTCGRVDRHADRLTSAIEATHRALVRVSWAPAPAGVA